MEINTPKSTTTQKVEPPKVEEQQQEEKVAVPTPPPVPEPVSEPISSSPAVVSASRTVSTDSPNEGGPVPQGDPRNWKVCACFKRFLCCDDLYHKIGLNSANRMFDDQFRDLRFAEFRLPPDQVHIRHTHSNFRAL